MSLAQKTSRSTVPAWDSSISAFSLRIRAEPAEPREAAACLRSSISRLTFKAPATPSCNGARGDLGAHQDLIDAGDQFLEII